MIKHVYSPEEGPWIPSYFAKYSLVMHLLQYNIWFLDTGMAYQCAQIKEIPLYMTAIFYTSLKCESNMQFALKESLSWLWPGFCVFVWCLSLHCCACICMYTLQVLQPSLLSLLTLLCWRVTRCNCFVKLLMIIDSVYELQITWFKRPNRITLPLRKESRCSNDTCRNKIAMKQLLLNPVSHYYDAGVYTCQAYNHHQYYTEKETFLTVEFNPSSYIHLNYTYSIVLHWMLKRW